MIDSENSMRDKHWTNFVPCCNFCKFLKGRSEQEDYLFAECLPCVCKKEQKKDDSTDQEEDQDESSVFDDHSNSLSFSQRINEMILEYKK